jgi:hypothetical protein
MESVLVFPSNYVAYLITLSLDTNVVAKLMTLQIHYCVAQRHKLFFFVFQNIFSIIKSMALNYIYI